MRNKQVELNTYIYTLSKLSRFGYEISVFKYKTGRYSEQPSEQPAHTSRLSLHGKMDVKIFLVFIVAENNRSVNILNCIIIFMYCYTHTKIIFLTRTLFSWHSSLAKLYKKKVLTYKKCFLEYFEDSVVILSQSLIWIQHHYDHISCLWNKSISLEA